MHEIALAQGAFDIAMAAVKQNRLITVDILHFNKARASCVCDELFKTAFAHIAMGSVAENAQILINNTDQNVVADFEITSIEGESKDEN